MINIGLLGLGTVGSGVYEIINQQGLFFKNQWNEDVKIKKVLIKHKEKERFVDIDDNLLTLNPKEILDDEEIDIVIDALSDREVAYNCIKNALENNKHVVTASKAVVAPNLCELQYLAKQKRKAFLFEASVGGGIPIINPLKQMIEVDNIVQIEGILNGTTNYILTKMYEEELPFYIALKDAQHKGYAELDPTDDIKGYDTARKLSILSTVAYGQKVNFDYIDCYGIDKIAIEDIYAFKEMDLTPKLIGKSKIKDGNIYAAVEPVLVSKDSSFFSVKDAFNLILLNGLNTGELHFYGQGAGKNPTANSIILDVINIIKGIYESENINIDDNTQEHKPLGFNGKYYFRFTFKDTKDIDLLLEDIVQYSQCKLIKENKNVIAIFEWLSRKNVDEIINKAQGLGVDYFYSRIDG